MRIYSISRIKNEEDIIESFVRYHLNFIDEMIIIEDYSDDETYNILQKLKDEGLPVHVYRNSKKPIPQQEVINNAYQIALNEFDADLVVPLDCDEFLVCKDDGNPREVLESLPHDRYFKVFWRTYLPRLDESSFSLDKFNVIRDPVLDDRSKIIIPSKLNESYDVVLTPGSHSVDDKEIPFEEIDELRIAHIPIRTKLQCISKEVIGWLNNISYYYKDPKSSWHQNMMYRMLTESDGELTDEQIMDYAKSYSSRRSSGSDIKEFEHPFDISFCSAMDLKYTEEFHDNGFVKILDFAENLALKYGKTNQMLEDVNEDIISKTGADSDYLSNLEDSYTHVKKELYFRNNSLVTRSKNYIGKIELKNERIEELKGTVSEKNARINELKGTISDKNDRIIELKAIIPEKNERISELKEAVSEKNIRIIDMKDKMAIKNSRIKELKDENEALKNKNKKLNKLNKEVLNSNSWKITKPLRKLLNIFR